MINKTFATLLTAGSILVSSSFSAAHAISMTGDTFMFHLEGGNNFGSDPVKLKVTLEDIGNDIKFTVDVLQEMANGTGNIADLRGLFFDI
uniref:hypothetical protein n=1 Tax=Okeania hirsuta TaxID=1458930 RepID=UPI00106864AE